MIFENHHLKFAKIKKKKKKKNQKRSIFESPLIVNQTFSQIEV